MGRSHSANIGRLMGQKILKWRPRMGKRSLRRPTARCTDDLVKLRGVVGCRWHRTDHAKNQSGRSMFSSGQQQADMMMQLYLLFGDVDGLVNDDPRDCLEAGRRRGGAVVRHVVIRVWQETPD